MMLFDTNNNVQTLFFTKPNQDLPIPNCIKITELSYKKINTNSSIYY